jgi:NADH-quinone oxidoreductase subunit L
MSAGVFAIAGIWPFAGFFSKDEILYRTFSWGNNPPLGKLLWLVGLVTAGMTAFYMFRLWFKTFFGDLRFEESHPKQEHDAHGHSGVHESPWIMLFPLAVLALLSVIGGWVGIPAALWGHNEIEHFLDPVFGSGGSAEAIASTAGYGLERTLAAVSLATAGLGLYVAWFFYCKKPGTATAIAQRVKPLYTALANKYWVDEFYGILVTALLMLSRVVEFLFDQGVVDLSGATAGAATRGLGSLVRRQISGNIRSYAGWLAFGAAAVLLVMTYGRALWGHL